MNRIGTREEWLAAREELLAREKEHTRLGDELARQRRELPLVPVEKDYRFDADDGERTLAALFDGRFDYTADIVQVNGKSQAKAKKEFD